MVKYYENKELCTQCGGKCCKKCGCDYLPRDFKDLSTNGLVNKILEGNISVVSTLTITKLPNGGEAITPILLLRERNKNRPVVDLLSLKTTCASLLETGCKYDCEHRPSGGRMLIPMENNKCYNENPDLKIQEWLSYQKILERVVKRITGKSSEECLREDVQNLFINCLECNYDEVSKLELEEIASLLPHLMFVYPNEYKSALEFLNKSPKRNRVNKKRP